MTPSAWVDYVTAPTEFAVLVIRRGAHEPFTPFADHVLQSNVERRRYPDHGRPPLMWIPTAIRTAVREHAWSQRHAE